jgi:hypothetical protein
VRKREETGVDNPQIQLSNPHTKRIFVKFLSDSLGYKPTHEGEGGVLSKPPTPPPAPTAPFKIEGPTWFAPAKPYLWLCG